MNLYIAEPSEIVRSHVRDEEHLEELELLLSSVVRMSFGRSGIILLSGWHSTIVRAMFHLFTTGQGVQTLGEEYLGLVQMDGCSSRKVASDIQRYLYIFVECSMELIMRKMCVKLSEYGRQLREANHLHPALYAMSQELPSLSNSLVDFVKAFNIAIFYIFGTPYHQISKAVTDIQYKGVRPQSNTEAQKLYKFLGVVSLIRLFVVAKKRFNRYEQQVDAEDSVSDSEYEHLNEIDSNKTTCPLCFEDALPVSTPCGHMYCWQCIERTSESTDSKGVLQCPTCRFQFTNSRTIPLMNL